MSVLAEMEKLRKNMDHLSQEELETRYRNSYRSLQDKVRKDVCDFLIREMTARCRFPAWAKEEADAFACDIAPLFNAGGIAARIMDHAVRHADIVSVLRMTEDEFLPAVRKLYDPYRAGFLVVDGNSKEKGKSNGNKNTRNRKIGYLSG